MRNVTKNTRGKTSLKEVKRGRGRPRKPDAMTNAQRQAAYRERKRAEPIKVTVTKNGGAEAELQVLRAELAQARDALRLEQEKALAAAQTHERRASVLRKRLALAEEELPRLKARLKGNESGPAFGVMLQLLAMACVRKSVNAQIAIRDSEIWQKGVVHASHVTDEQMKRLGTALEGKI